MELQDRSSSRVNTQAAQLNLIQVASIARVQTERETLIVNNGGTAVQTALASTVFSVGVRDANELGHEGSEAVGGASDVTAGSGWVGDGGIGCAAGGGCGCGSFSGRRLDGSSGGSCVRASLSSCCRSSSFSGSTSLRASLGSSSSVNTSSSGGGGSSTLITRVTSIQIIELPRRKAAAVDAQGANRNIIDIASVGPV